MAFGAFEFIVPEYYCRFGKMDLRFLAFWALRLELKYTGLGSPEGPKIKKIQDFERD